MRLIVILLAASVPALADDSSFDGHLAAGKLALQQSRYPEARKQLDAAIKDAANFDAYDLRVAAVLEAYSDWNALQGQHAEAESLERRIVQIREHRLGPENPALSPYLRRLAAELRAEARTEQAEPILLRSLSIGEKNLWRGRARTHSRSG
ncbi:MAG: tetratricopeptide repeat protein [Acidobacteriota bacterium]|nr:tetratricopeptide repeat protein [Acidobacteriota bacterium]